MMSSLSALLVLGIIIMALLLIISAVSLEQVASALGRGIAAFILVLWATCIVKGIVAAALPALGSFFGWIAVVGFAIGGLLLVVWLAKFRKSHFKKTDTDGGEL